MDDQTQPLRPTIAAQADAQVTAMVNELREDERAVVAATGDNAGWKVGGAADLGKGIAVGGHVEKKAGTEGVGWFAGIRKRWLKR